MYQHFRDMGNKDAWGRYRERLHPSAMLFVPRVGLSAPDKYKRHMDLAGVIMPHMESTIMHAHLSGSAFTLDGSDTVTAR